MFKDTAVTRNRIAIMIEKFKDVDAHAVLIETELTQVIGDANFLKESKKETYKMFVLFQNQTDGLFQRDRQSNFEKLILDFESDLSNLDLKISKALNEQFASVRSSIDKFKMLEKFKSIYKVLKDESADNFNEVLEDYTKIELHNYTMIFENHKNNPPVSDTIPYYARKIIWAKQLYNRGYAPFAYLAKNQEKLDLEKTQKNNIIESFKRFRKLF